MNTPLRIMFAALAASGIVALVAGYMLGGAPRNKTPFGFKQFGDTPVLMDGRVKPLDSVARNRLMMLSGKSIPTKADGTRVTPAQWMADVTFDRQKAATYKVFRIDNLDVKTLLGLNESEKYFSLADIFQRVEILDKQIKRAIDMPEEKRGVFEQNILALSTKIRQYQLIELLGSRIQGMGMAEQSIHPIPPKGEDGVWRNLADGAADVQSDEIAAATLTHWDTMQKAYVAGNIAGFNDAVAGYHGFLTGELPGIIRKTRFESGFNRMDPFMWSTALYVGALVLVFVSWLGGRHVLAISAAVVIVIALIMQTYGITARILISGNAPVTNLYSSAVFIGWAAVLICLILEAIFRNTFSLVTACIVGFACLLISRGLATDGDTMPVLQAVLASNFWLSTHVLAITLGYAAVFLAGILGIIFIVAGTFMPSLDKTTIKNVGQMIYGITAFAVFFSFVGTVLGGIWADQSWGRFWGWDPKENGAVLIVLWTAMMLHARWGGMAQQRGMAVLAVFGGIVTSWSWFGTNMLGAGLHSYGFTDSRDMWLWSYVLSQLLVMNIGMHPAVLWATRSLPKVKPLTPAQASNGLLAFRLGLHTLASFLLVLGTTWCLLTATTNMGAIGMALTSGVGFLLIAFASLAASNAWIRLLSARRGGQADPPPPSRDRRAAAAGS